jgi:hypothetical protein
MKIAGAAGAFPANRRYHQNLITDALRAQRAATVGKQGNPGEIDPLHTAPAEWTNQTAAISYHLIKLPCYKAARNSSLALPPRGLDDFVLWRKTTCNR